MYNLLVRYGGWSGRRDEISLSRIYIPQDDPVLRLPNGSVNFAALTQIPALFVEETARGETQFARVGSITSITAAGASVSVQYSYEPNVPPIPHEEVMRLAAALDIPMPTRGFTAFEHSHWRVPGADLYKVIATEVSRPDRTPRVFQLREPQLVEEDLLSTMMPFAGFGGIYHAIQGAAANNLMRCHRADDIWENHAIIQDVVDLIDRSSIVVCDCTNRNPNVFYEIGVAHALGKEVILITQSGGDVPFDLAHIRHIRYFANDLHQLTVDLTARIQAIRARR
ncbi:hypothetical protein KVG96_20860 [Pseudomonas sp. COR58]|uniref:Nucleoside 2-deoxyribosyltransferase n=1 Tax=Pseudomonas ekonensis TaxID=2842353 RepID=A0ABS6PJM5_9PSED|nr:hypothetical protein [Pseudomonas ekonensis]MBV4460414.1 hypothetical protein [Pseudomonas ekonensis]